MSRSPSETFDEPDARLEPKTAGMLIYVLRYENLRAADSFIAGPLTHEGSCVQIGRITKLGPVHLDGHTLHLPDPFASRRHAQITRHQGADFIEDCESKLGTYVNQERILGSRPLADGDCIEIGHSLLVYRLVNPKDALQMSVFRAGMVHGPTRTLSPILMGISADLEFIARSSQPVLFLAETGAGKEIAARFVHDRSGRKGPFVAIDCGAIPKHLVESELFGHKRGAFSGAGEERIGRIRSADGGTVFLDEIGNMPLSAQASLLRVIQEREIIPLGADRGKAVDVRWIAATNSDIFSEQSGFRPDLRSRLAGYVGRLPPLRERREDLGLLAAYILEQTHTPSPSITRRAAHALFLSQLPGNIRELKHILTTAAILANENPIDLSHLGTLAVQLPNPDNSTSPSSERAERLEGPESRPRPYTRRPPKAEIEDALNQAKWVQSDAARRLGVHERQLSRWMDAYGIERAKQKLGQKS